MNKNRIILFFIFLVVFTIIFQLGSMSTVSQVEADLFMEEFKKLVLDIDAFGIFVHNTIIEIGIVIALLLAGGYIEFYMIELVENENLEMPGF